MSKRVIVEGRELIVPDDATPDEIDEIARQGSVPRNSVEQSPGKKAGDQVEAEEGPGVLSRLASGVRRGMVDPVVDAAGAAIQGVIRNPAGTANTFTDPVAIGRNVGGAMLEGAQSGATEQFTKMFEQYDKGGLEDRGPDGTGLSTTGRAIAGAVPFLGPASADLVERGAGGDVAGAVGEFGGLLALGEIPRFVGAKGGAMIDAASNRAAAGTIAREGMSATRVGAAAKNAADLKAAKEAAEAVKGMVGLGLEPTNIERANATLGVKAKHLKTGYEPGEALLRHDIDTSLPRREIKGKIQEKLDTFSAQKKDQLEKAGVVATGKDVVEAADMLTPLLKSAKDVKNTALAKRVSGARNTLRSLAEGELTAADLEKVIGRVDDMIEASTGASGRKVKTVLYKIRKQLSDIQTRNSPELRATNKELRDFMKGKEAVSQRILEEEASQGPKGAGEIPEPEGLPRPANPPFPQTEKAAHIDPMTALEMVAAMNGVPWWLRMGARRIIKRR